MTDKAEEDVWYSERLESLVRFGFQRAHVETFLHEDEAHVVDRLAWLEARREQASQIEDRIVSFRAEHPHHDVDFSLTTEALTDPFAVDDAHSSFERMMTQHAPWEPALERGKVAWHDFGLGEDWSRLYQRLANLDASSAASIQILYPLFGHPERFDELFRHLDIIEMDEDRQRSVMRQGYDSLKTMGYNLPSIEHHSLMDAFAVIEKWQDFHHTSEQLKLSITQLVTPFDRELSLNLERRRSSLTSIEQVDELHAIEREVNRLGQTFEDRRLEVSAVIQGWRGLGIIFPHDGDLHPSELMEWEANLESIKDSIDQHLGLVERWHRFERYWPSRVETSRKWVGQLEHSDDLQDAVDELDQLWKQLELDGLSLLDHFEGAGLVLDEWRQRLFEDPLRTMELLTHTRPKWDRAVSLIEDLESIDVSFEGADGTTGRIRLLRETELSAELMDESERFIHERTRRNNRHRDMLNRELADLRIADKIGTERDTSALSLNEFESYIATLQRSDSAATLETASSIPTRFISQLNREVEQLKEAGWDVEDWLSSLADHPGDVARQLNLARQHIQHHEVLRRRLQYLPWNKDVNLALQLELDLRRPSRLPSLSEKIPALSAHLAQRAVEDESFELKLWKPKIARPTLVPLHERERSVQAPGDTLEDAHEAMLEAMEPHEQEENLGTAEESALPALEQPSSLKGDSEPVETPLEVQHVEAPPETPPEVQHVETPPTSEEKVVVKQDEQLNEKVTSEPLMPSPKDIVVEPQDANGEGTSSALKALTALLSQLGLTEAAHSAEHIGLNAMGDVRRAIAGHVNVTPRDVRIARLLRITLRCLPDGSGDDQQRAEVLQVLSNSIKPLKKWMRHRLESRHSGASGDLLKDAAELGTALTRIPGPGRRVPMVQDEYVLPHELNEIKMEAQRLYDAIVLPSAGGVAA
jgi:hypothetical protein